jgi:Domain of unknown function (DUF397)
MMPFSENQLSSLKASCLYVMSDAADPNGAKLYFTQAEWDAFILGVKDGEFDSSEDGSRPPVP